jgi:hypothetical protein
VYISYDFQNSTQYLSHIPRTNGSSVLQKVQAGHQKGRRASRDLRVCSAGAMHAFSPMRGVH